MTLEKELQCIVDNSHARTWGTFDGTRKAPEAYGLTQAKVKKWKTPGEPAFVSGLLDGLFVKNWRLKFLCSHLMPSGLCAGDPLVSGVFMHQKPKVKFSHCHVELADLLLVRHHFVVGTGPIEVQARASLLQAKAGLHPKSGKLSGKEAEQFKLYSNWNTPLSFPNGELGQPADGSAKWNLGQGPMPHASQSGLYGFVFNGRPGRQICFPNRCTWATGWALKGNQVNGNDSLANYLAQFLTGQAGRPWDLTPQSGDHWSQFVLRCLEKAVDWTYPVQRMGTVNQPRLRQALAFVSAFDSILQTDELKADTFDRRHVWAQQFGDDYPMPPDIFPERTETRRPSGGVSVLYIATFGPKQLGEVAFLDNEFGNDI